MSTNKIIKFPIEDDMRVLADLMGGFRRLVNNSYGVKDLKIGKQNHVDSDQDGVLAEFIFAKWQNVFPDISIGPRAGSYDMIVKGKKIDIKSTRHIKGKLLSSMHVNPDIDIYVLAIIENDWVSFPGYAYKNELIKQSNIIDLGYGDVYGMEQSMLRKFNELP